MKKPVIVHVSASPEFFKYKKAVRAMQEMCRLAKIQIALWQIKK